MFGIISTFQYALRHRLQKYCFVLVKLKVFDMVIGNSDDLTISGQSLKINLIIIIIKIDNFSLGLWSQKTIQFQNKNTVYRLRIGQKWVLAKRGATPTYQFLIPVFNLIAIAIIFIIYIYILYGIIVLLCFWLLSDSAVPSNGKV